MARELGRLYVGIDCSNCGVHGEGVPASNGRTRCGKCGRFGGEPSGYCAEHDVEYGKLHGYDHCPICREEQRINDMELHLATRDRTMEPW